MYLYKYVYICAHIYTGTPIHEQDRGGQDDCPPAGVVFLCISLFFFFLCSGYHYCTTSTSFNKAWTQVLHRFKSCSRHVGDSRWWGSLTMVPAGNKAKRLSSVNHTTRTIHHHHHLILRDYVSLFAFIHLC